MKNVQDLQTPIRLVNNQPQSILTLGTAQFGLTYGITNQTGKPSQDAVNRLVQTAVDHGITHLDCAQAYGDAENRIGRAIKQLSTNTPCIITKLDPLTGLNQQTSAHEWIAAVDASIEGSCQNLGITQLPFLLLHRWEHYHLLDGLIWQRLQYHQRNGTIQNLGASVETPAQALAALNIPDIQLLQLPFNVLDNRWKRAGVDQKALDRPDCRIHARSTLLQGILSANASLWPTLEGLDPQFWIDKLTRLQTELRRESLQDLCFAYVQAQPWIHSLVVGVEHSEQLLENIRLLCNAPLTPADVLHVENTMGGASEQLLNPSLWPQKC